MTDKFVQYDKDSWFELAWVRTGETADHDPPYTPKNPINPDLKVVWVWDNLWKEWRLYEWFNNMTIGKSLPEPECWPETKEEAQHRSFHRWHVGLGIAIVVLLVLVMAFRTNGSAHQQPTQPAQDGSSLDMPIPQETSVVTPVYPTECGTSIPWMPSETYVADDGTHFRIDPDNDWIPAPGGVYCVSDPELVFGMFTQDASVAELAAFNISADSSFTSGGTILRQAATMWGSRYRNSIRETNPTAYLKRWNEVFYTTWLSWLQEYDPTNPIYIIAMPTEAPVDMVDQARLLKGETLPVPTVEPRKTVTPTPFQPNNSTNTPWWTNGTPFPTITGVVQTPYVTMTPTPGTVATLVGGTSNIQTLSAVSFNDLILKTDAGMAIWNLPGVDSIEIRLEWSQQYQVNFYAGWAPSFANAQYVFEIRDTDALGAAAVQAGCSAFNFTDQSGFIYEQRVSMHLKYVFSDTAGINYYLFPAGQTSVGYCLLWPTSTPRPTAVFTSTPLPTGVVATPTDWLSDCNITISWTSLLNNPGQVTGSGNSWLGKHNMNDPLDNHYYGDRTGYSILYCITERPTTIGGKPWNGHIISLTGPIYGGAVHEVNITGTIWVSEIWP